MGWIVPRDTSTGRFLKGSGRPILIRLREKLSLGRGHCWVWNGARNARGYGVIGIGGHDGSTVLVHRLLFESRFGAVPVGMDLDHVCRNPSCANPAHLEVVDHRTNVLRGSLRTVAIHNSGMCHRGHPRSESYLTADGAVIYCKTCRREYRQEWRQRRRAEGLRVT